MKPYKGKSFETIVRQYKAIVKKRPDRHIDFCLEQKTLADVIETAAKAIDNRNKIHGHQTRVGRVKLDFFANQLLLVESQIKQSKTFDELLTVVESVKCDRIAKLTHYDTATRIGAYLELFPEKIYLHTGTKDGARHLLGDIGSKTFITVDELPEDFRRHGLTAPEFEDILCIFKNDFMQSDDSLTTQEKTHSLITKDFTSKKACC